MLMSPERLQAQIMVNITLLLVAENSQCHFFGLQASILIKVGSITSAWIWQDGIVKLASTLCSEDAQHHVLSEAGKCPVSSNINTTAACEMIIDWNMKEKQRQADAMRQ